MKKISILFYLSFFIRYLSFSQSVGIGTTTPNSSAQLEISSSTKGLLVPRMTTAAINSISNPAKGLLVYDSLKNQLMVNMGTVSSKNWQTIVFTSGWSLGGNSNTSPANQFMGTIDNQPLRFRVNNTWAGEIHASTGNIFFGLRAGQGNTTGYSNVALGTDALKLNTTHNNLVAIGDSALFNNGNATSTSVSQQNTAIGTKSLYANTTGSYNTAAGYRTLNSNTTGVENTAIGTLGLASNTVGSNNTAIGYQSLPSNTSAAYNTAVGSFSLLNNTTGEANSAIGNGSLAGNTTGEFNTATGAGSLNTNTTGEGNTATGYDALGFNTVGSYNTAMGYYSLKLNNSSLGSYNTAMGYAALYNTTSSQFNTAIGFNAGGKYDLGYNNTIVGANSDASFAGQYNIIAIGQGTVCPDNSTVRFGNTATWSVGSWAGWSNFSDGRFKKDIQEDVKGLDFIMKLRPVTYHLDAISLSKQLKENHGQEWNDQMKTAMAEKEKMLLTGFVAQEVEQAAKDLGYDFSGVDKPKRENDLYGLRYAEFVVPLVKAVQEQQQQIVELKNTNKNLQRQIDELKMLIKK